MDKKFSQEFSQWTKKSNNDSAFATEFPWVKRSQFPWESTDKSHASRTRKKVAEFLWDLKVRYHPLRTGLLSHRAASSVRSSLSVIMDNAVKDDATMPPFSRYDGISIEQSGAPSLESPYLGYRDVDMQNSLVEKQRISVANAVEAIFSVPGLKNGEGALDKDIWEATDALRQVVKIGNVLRLPSTNQHHLGSDY
jgi:hypothetical protein